MPDTFRLQNRLFQAKDALERSKLEFQDVLIGQGFKLYSLELGKKQHNHITKLSEEMNPLLFYYELKD